MKIKDYLLIGTFLGLVGSFLYITYSPAKIVKEIDYDHEKKVKDSIVLEANKKIDSLQSELTHQEKITGVWMKNYRSLENLTDKYNEKYGSKLTDSAFFVVLDSLRATGLGTFKHQ